MSSALPYLFIIPDRCNLGPMRSHEPETPLQTAQVRSDFSWWRNDSRVFVAAAPSHMASATVARLRNSCQQWPYFLLHTSCNTSRSPSRQASVTASRAKAECGEEDLIVQPWRVVQDLASVSPYPRSGQYSMLSRLRRSSTSRTPGQEALLDCPYARST